MGIFGMTVGTLIGFYYWTGIVCSGVGVGLGVGITGGARGIARCMRFDMDSTVLVVASPQVNKLI